MQEIRLRNEETGRVETHMARKLAEKAVKSYNPQHKAYHRGLATLYQLENPEGRWERNNYMVTLEVWPGEYQIDVVHDFYHVGEFVKHVMQQENDPLRAHAFGLLCAAAPNDPDLIPVVNKINEFRLELREKRKKEFEGAAQEPPQPPVEGYFSDRDPIYADPDALAVPQI